ncbi:MAG: transcription antitermination factor NusB [Bacteroidales bacterium]
MLSRRHLRIKVLQAVYAYHQQKDRNLESARKQLFVSIDRLYDLAIYQISFLTEIVSLARNLIEEGRKKHLPSPEDLNPNMRFAENALIHKIENNRNFLKHINRLKISWGNYPEIIRRLFLNLRNTKEYAEYMATQPGHFKTDKEFALFVLDQIIVNDPGIQALLEEKNIFWANDALRATFRITSDMLFSENQEELPDREIFIKLFREAGSPAEGVEILVEEESFYPENDYHIGAGLAKRILNEIKASWDEFSPLPPLFKPALDEDDSDETFASRLFLKTILRNDEIADIIADKITNWDPERLALMDMLLLKMAVVELTEFPTIPIKVTLNEYIDLAKAYSTPRSGQFVNGVLDRVVANLTELGQIQKTGRGLLG